MPSLFFSAYNAYTSRFVNTSNAWDFSDEAKNSDDSYSSYGFNPSTGVSGDSLEVDNFSGVIPQGFVVNGLRDVYINIDGHADDVDTVPDNGYLFIQLPDGTLSNNVASGIFNDLNDITLSFGGPIDSYWGLNKQQFFSAIEQSGLCVIYGIIGDGDAHSALHIDYIELQINYISTPSGTFPLYLHNTQSTGQFPLYEAGHLASDSGFPLTTTGIGSSTGDFPLFLFNLSSSSGDFPLSIPSTYGSGVENFPLYLEVYASGIDSFPIVIGGLGSGTDSFPIYTYGIHTQTGIIPLFVLGNTETTISSGTPLFIYGNSTGSSGLNDLFPVHLQGDNLPAILPLFLLGGGSHSVSSGIPIHMVGVGNFIDNGFPLYVVGPSGQSSGIPLYINGLSTSLSIDDVEPAGFNCTGGIPLFLFRWPGEAVPLYLACNVISSSLVPIYTCGAIPATGDITLFLNTGEAELTESFNIMTRGF